MREVWGCPNLILCLKSLFSMGFIFLHLTLYLTYSCLEHVFPFMQLMNKKTSFVWNFVKILTRSTLLSGSYVWNFEGDIKHRINFRQPYTQKDWIQLLPLTFKWTCVSSSFPPSVCVMLHSYNPSSLLRMSDNSKDDWLTNRTRPRYPSLMNSG